MVTNIVTLAFYILDVNGTGPFKTEINK